jgi:flagellin-like protein
MFKSKSRKGVSEIISVTLLIVIVVILAGLFFAWSKN